MAARTLVLTRRFLRALDALQATGGTQRGASVAATLRALTSAAALPSAGDVEAMIPPVVRAWVRRVNGENLWVWYQATDATVTLVALTSSPPVPIG